MSIVFVGSGFRPERRGQLKFQGNSGVKEWGFLRENASGNLMEWVAVEEKRISGRVFLELLEKGL